MPTPFSFQRYQLQNQQGEQLVDIDFAQQAKVPQSLMQQVLADLRSFAGHFMPGHLSQLELKHEDSQLKLEKHHDNKVVTADAADKLAQLETHLQQSALVFLPQEITAQHLIEYLQRVQPVEGEAVNIAEVEAEFIKLAGEIGQKLVEAEQKLQAAEQELTQQRQADDAQLTVGQLDGQIGEIEQKLATADKLIAKQSELEAELAKIQSGGDSFGEEQVATWRAQIQQFREAQFAALATEGNHTFANTATDENDKAIQQYGLTQPALFWGMVLLLLVMGGISYLVNRNPLAPIAAVAGSLVVLLIYHTANRIPRELNMAAVKNQRNANTGGAEGQLKQLELPADQLQELEQKFIQKAWLEVYQQEVNNMKQVVADKLDGESHEQMLALIEDLKIEISELQKAINQQKQRELTPDKYLAKRREVDMLKVEKARLDTDLRTMENFQQVNELRTQLDLHKAGQNAKQDLATLIQQISGYQDVRYHDNQLQAQGPNGEWTTIELTKEQIQQLAAVYLTEFWLGGEVMGPLILVDWDKTIPRVVRSKISDRMNKHKSDPAQVIFISTI